MKEFKRTPGPWKQWHEDVVIMESEESVTIVAACIENEYDVNLIAAAPELLKCLQEMTEAMNEIAWQEWVGEIIENSEKAIAKALGEAK